MALRYQSLLDIGVAASKSELARQVGISRERLNQILALTRLAPRVQRAILKLPEPERRQLSERRLRRIAALPSAEEQMQALKARLRATSTPVTINCEGSGNAGRIHDDDAAIHP